MDAYWQSEELNCWLLKSPSMHQPHFDSTAQAIEVTLSRQEWVTCGRMWACLYERASAFYMSMKSWSCVCVNGHSEHISVYRFVEHTVLKAQMLLENYCRTEITSSCSILWKPVAHKWKKNGTKLPGTTQNVLQRNNPKISLSRF